MIKKSSILFLFSSFLFLQPAFGGQVVKSTLDDQTSVEVTVYNNQLGLIKDVRKLSLPEGQAELRFMDVAAQIRPVTVLAKSLNQTDHFGILEQNYEYDLMNQNKLLDKYVGKNVKILLWHEYQDRMDEVDAELLSNNGGQIYRINDQIYLGHPGIKVLPGIPENLIARPTLSWLYENSGKAEHDLEVTYLTNGISWKADYVVVVDKKDEGCDIAGWVTIDNQSGATYRDAKLKLVAGDVNRVQEPRHMRKAFARAEVMMADAGAAQFQEESFFEYHIYNLSRTTTLKERQTKQISLLDAAGVGLEKELLVHGASHYYTRAYQGQLPISHAQVYFEFKNSEKNQLGMPLPKGIMRLYKKDSSGSLQFIGEDRINHTPKNEKVRLKIGKAFDVVSERRQTDYDRLTTKKHESEWEITIRNHKKEKVTVGVIEPLYGNWKIVSHDHPYEKVDANTIRFDVEVKPDQEVKVTYRVRVGI